MTGTEIEVVPGVMGPEEFTRESYIDPSGSGPVLAVRIRFDKGLRRYACEELTLRRDGPAPISAEDLRSVAVGDVVRQVIRIALLVKDQDTSLRFPPAPEGVEPWGVVPPAGIAEEGPSDRVLRWVAHVYRYSVALDLVKPTAGVQELMGVSRATAGRWVTAARACGYLGAALRGRPGEREQE
jgi:hypothetical protein